MSINDTACEKVVILGSGIAGLTAAIYTARSGLEPLILSGDEPGGQLTLTTDVENYPGFPEGIQGPELIENMRSQAERFGARYRFGLVTSTILDRRPFQLTLDDGDSIETESLIVATGARARMLGLDGEDDLIGHGLSTCATCDGAFFQDARLVVVGGGDSAMEESMFLTRYASEVYVVHRRDEFRASQIMVDRAAANDKIEFILNSEVTELHGRADSGIHGVTLINNETGKTRGFDCDGVFYAIGHIPNTGMLGDQLKLDGHGYIVSDGVFTSVPGVFAAGDVMDPKYQQAVTAAGTGCQAALETEAFIENHPLNEREPVRS